MAKFQAWRLKLVSIVVVLCFILIIVRIFYLQFLQAKELTQRSAKQCVRVIEIKGGRGRILDRNGTVLAFNMPSWSLYAQPRFLRNKGYIAKKISGILGEDEAEIRKKISQEKNFVWIRRRLPLEIKEKVERLDLKGIGFIKEPCRIYPQDTLACHVLGFTDVDNKGLEGVELYYDSILRGQEGYVLLWKDARRQDFYLEEGVEPFPGDDLLLTIDSFLQSIVEEELERRCREFGAKSASCVIMNPYTGEILSMANFPYFSPNHPQDFPVSFLRNRAITDIYEPGSVFKIVTAIAALSSGEVDLADKFFCENGAYRIHSHILHDYRPHGVLTFEDVIVKSSNIGVCKIAQRIGLGNVIDFARRLGFGKITGIDLPGEQAGLLKDTKDCSPLSISSIPMGQEVAVTCLQMARAFSCIANGGFLVSPHVVKKIISPEGLVVKEIGSQLLKRVLSPEVCKTMREILFQVVERGTGRLARIKGLKIAGKTGTAQKPEAGGYSQSLYRASFVGFFPADNPRIVISIVFDEPHKSHLGGVVAAPLFKKIVLRIKDYLELKSRTEFAFNERRRTY